jgi:hypothetical protein
MATSPPTKVLPTAPTGSSGWVLEAKGKDPGSLNISRDISAGANQSITVRPGTQFRMKPTLCQHGGEAEPAARAYRLLQP